MVELVRGDFRECLDEVLKKYADRNIVVVSDPPFNIGYKYATYDDKLEESEYLELMNNAFSKYPSVIIHYPEQLYRIASRIGKFPTRVVSWVYNSNTARQHRDIAFFDVKPDFNQVLQPYKNLNDKRIQQRIADGKVGCKLYDWWDIDQVKNVNIEKTPHPCQMPLRVMKNIVGLLPKDTLVIDPFMGSGTTGIACVELGYDFIGVEIDADYFEIAKTRIRSALGSKGESLI